MKLKNQAADKQFRPQLYVTSTYFVVWYLLSLNGKRVFSTITYIIPKQKHGCIVQFC